MKPFSLIPYGPHSWLINSSDHSLLKTYATICENAPPTHFLEWVMGYDSLLLIFSQSIRQEIIEEHFRTAYATTSLLEDTGKHHEILVSYNGPDLQDVAKSSGLSSDEIVKRHCEPEYTVRFLGFAPGFAYLDGLDESLVLPRRDSPRERMDSGAVAIGGPHTGIYTVPSPGGWHWIGKTRHTLFDPKTEFLAFSPGDTVKLVPSHV